MSKAILIMARTKKKTPIPRDDMMSTNNNELCKNCIYGIPFSAGNHNYACYYLVRTGKRRGCPEGWCDKYEEGKPQAYEWIIDLNNNEAWSDGKTYEV